MTREETIKWLESLKAEIGKSGNRTLWHYAEAIDMAIEALSAKPQTDLISRANAIRWVKTECNPYGKPTLEFESGKRVIEHLEQMPSAEPKTGVWILNHDGSWNCSECGLRVFVYAKGNYCPNCGAKMTKGDDTTGESL